MILSGISEQSIPVPCPFQGTYTFSYTNGSVECQNPPSEIRSCADESKFRFVYRRCHGIPGTSNQGEFLSSKNMCSTSSEVLQKSCSS